MATPAQVKIPAPAGVDAAMVDLFGAAGFTVAATDDGQALVTRAAELNPMIGEQNAFPVAVDMPFDDAEIAGLRAMVVALATPP